MSPATRTRQPVPEWQFVAVSDQTGARHKGTMTAASEQAVADVLLREGRTPVSIRQVRSLSIDADLGSLLKRRVGSRVRLRDLATMTRDLQMNVGAGLPLTESLRLLAEGRKAPVAAMWNELADQLASGRPLADAMADYPDVFDDTYRAYIAAGSATGDLTGALDRLARQLSDRYRLRSKVVASTTYGMIVAAVASVIILAMLIFVVPRFASMYDGLGVPLPAPTKMLLDLSAAMTPLRMWDTPLGVPLPVPNPTSPLVWLLAAVVGLVVFYRRTRTDLNVGARLDRIRWKLPLLGKMTHLSALNAWSMTMAGSLTSGLQLVQALELAATASGSRWIQKITPQMAEHVTAGRRLADGLAQHPQVFPVDAVVSRVRSGEESGDLDGRLANSAEFTQVQLGTIAEGLSGKLEVALILSLGVIVGAFVIIIYLPLLNLTGAQAQNMGL